VIQVVVSKLKEVGRKELLAKEQAKMVEIISLAPNVGTHVHM
jgi:hypothetical protein